MSPVKLTLVDILDIDTEYRVVMCEPLVSSLPIVLPGDGGPHSGRPSNGGWPRVIQPKARTNPQPEVRQGRLHPCVLSRADGRDPGERQKPDYHDFVECFMFSREEAVMMTGNMVETAHTDKLNETGLWHKS